MKSDHIRHLKSSEWRDMIDVTCAILAGGESRRMGENKAFVRIGNVKMLDCVINVCRKVFTEIVIVTKSPELYKGCKETIVKDRVEQAGPLGGLYTGLLSAHYDYIFCVACDMPTLNERVIRYLLDRRFHYDAVIPVVNDGMEPLHAIYSKRCIPVIEESLKKGILAIPRFFHEVKTLYCDAIEIRKIDPLLNSFTNVNTKEQLQEMLHVQI